MDLFKSPCECIKKGGMEEERKGGNSKARPKLPNPKARPKGQTQTTYPNDIPKRHTQTTYPKESSRHPQKTGLPSCFCAWVVCVSCVWPFWWGISRNGGSWATREHLRGATRGHQGATREQLSCGNTCVTQICSWCKYKHMTCIPITVLDRTSLQFIFTVKDC